LEWAKVFYQKQYELLERRDVWPRVWANRTPGETPPRVQLMERLAGSGPKRVLELGCGSGLVAGATAEAGHSVVAVDLAPIAATSARQIASTLPSGQMEVVEGDFLEIDLSGPFDVVTYFDGFGVGSDEDQQRLLHRVSAWLANDGCALIDVYNPYYFARIDGIEYDESDTVLGRTDFDPESCRLTNRIWPKQTADDAITQSLRCYSPADLRVLLKDTGLGLQHIEPHESEPSARPLPMKEAPTYLAQLIPG
jgi:SAM-dependent methyltransferase